MAGGGPGEGKMPVFFRSKLTDSLHNEFCASLYKQFDIAFPKEINIYKTKSQSLAGSWIKQ